MFLVEHKLPRIIHEFSFNLWSIYGNSCLPKKTKNSMLLQHVKEHIEIVFQLISDAKVQHSTRALSVSDHFRPQTASFGWISPFTSVCSYKSMPYCSATYLTATGGSTLSRGLTPSMASSSLWRESHLWRVFTDTPAASASWAFDIDFMIIDEWLLIIDDWLLMILKRRYLRWPSQVSALGIAGICDEDRSRERGWQVDTYIYKKVVREEINVLYSKRISRFRDFLYNIVSPCHPGASERQVRFIFFAMVNIWNTTVDIALGTLGHFPKTAVLPTDLLEAKLHCHFYGKIERKWG